MKNVVVTVTVSDEIDIERYNRAFQTLCADIQRDNDQSVSGSGIVASRQFVIITAMTGGLFGFLEALRVTDTIIEYAVRTEAD